MAGFGDEDFDPTGPWALDIPLAVHLLLAWGIDLFRTYQGDTWGVPGLQQVAENRA
jgi:hypothetical protein